MTHYLEQFEKLKVDRAHGPPSVHKPCMLLAVIDLAERGVLSRNEIRYEDTLDVFRDYSEAARPGEPLHPYFPFYHLRGEGFWHLCPKPDESDEGRKPRHRSMLGRSARLAEGLYVDMTTNVEARRVMRDVLIGRWLGERRAEVEAVIQARHEANEYESRLRTNETTDADSPRPDDTARRQSFRRLVLQAYDYRCAATGSRIVLPDVGPLVDAAHLIPFTETRDDRPCNGIALAPTYHRAMDRHLIAPGPDMKWRVSRKLDKRISDYQPFVSLEGQSVIFHGHPKFHPSPEALRWRIDHLLS